MQYLSKKQLLLCIIPIVALIVCLALYSYRPQTLPYRNPSAPYIANSAVAKDWMPQSVYTKMMSYLDRYLATSNITNKSMSVQGRPSVNQDGQVIFTLQINGQPHTVAVRTFYYGSGILSTSVTIDGNLQDQSVPPSQTTTNNSSQSPAATTFNNFDQLVNVGLTTAEANSLQYAFQKFAPSAQTVTVDSSTINPDTNQSNGDGTFSFTVTVDNKKYTALVDCPVDLTSVQLTLTDQQSGKQVFDSGVIGSQS